MAPSGSIWHKESLKLKEIFGTREAFEICPNNFSPRPNFAPPGTRRFDAAVHYSQYLMCCCRMCLGCTGLNIEHVPILGVSPDCSSTFQPGRVISVLCSKSEHVRVPLTWSLSACSPSQSINHQTNAHSWPFPLFAGFAGASPVL